ncbi:hypothetical protein [Rudaeicoccus suwonensis]|nr:hypothetical protein [Rudaeicoccus suwonensis]
MPLPDEEIAALSLRERLELIRRLRADDAIGSVVRRIVQQRARRRRRISLVVASVCCGVLVPWAVYLGMTLPHHYESDNWQVTWAGFDGILVITLALTAYFAWKQRILVVLTAFASGALLLADAWFDVTTSTGHDVRMAVLTAIFIEIPLAVFLIAVAVDIIWRVAELLNVVTGQKQSSYWTTQLNDEIVQAAGQDDE